MISVIVPAYNVQQYIAACLDSILSQGVTIEIIAVNDGSADNTRAILDDYASRNKCIKIFETAHEGPSAARNVALDHCSGDWITMVDGDDILLPGALKKMLDTAVANPGTDMVCGRFVYFDDEVKPVSCKKFTKLYYGDETVEMMLYKNSLADVVNSSAWGKLYRRKLWVYQRFSPGLVYEDLEVVPRVAFGVRQVAAIGDCVYGYRRNKKGIIRSFGPVHADMIEATTRLQEFFVHEPRLRKAAVSRHFSALFNLYLRINATGADMPEEAEKCRKELRSLAPGQIFARRVRFKNRVGAMLQYLPFLFKSPRFCNLFLTK